MKHRIALLLTALLATFLTGAAGWYGLAAAAEAEDPPMLRVAAKIDETDGELVYGMGFDEEREDDLVIDGPGVGIVAGDGGTTIWPLVLGPARAKELLLTGDKVDAETAERIGLVNHVVPAAELMDAARASVSTPAPTWM